MQSSPSWRGGGHGIHFGTRVGHAFFWRIMAQRRARQDDNAALKKYSVHIVCICIVVVVPRRKGRGTSGSDVGGGYGAAAVTPPPDCFFFFFNCYHRRAHSPHGRFNRHRAVDNVGT